MKSNKKINLAKTLFGIYCLLLVWIILFKFSVSINDIIGLDKLRKINLIPFYYSNGVVLFFYFKEVIENLLIFIPFGIYLKMLNKDNRKIFLSGCLFSIILEISQFILKLGVTDITDIITNSFGVAIGVYLYVLLEKIFKNREKINKILKIIALIGTILLCSMLLLLLLSN